jgi:5-methylcytosine-specific restriction enzyme A
MSSKPKKFKPKRAEGKKFVSKERTDRQAMYNTKWIKYRLRFLHHNPQCYCCPNKSSVIDHIVPHKGRVDFFWDITNFIPMCETCHNIVTAKFDKHGSHLVVEKLQWIEKNRKFFSVRVKVKIVRIKDDDK